MKQVKLLVVDDEQGIRDLMLETFRGTSTHCDTAESAEEAMERVRQGKPDVVLLDLELPGMDGLQAFRRIKEIHPAVIVIIITGHGTIERAKEAMDLGAYEYVMKPLKMKEVERLIEHALRIHRLEQVVTTLREKVTHKRGAKAKKP